MMDALRRSPIFPLLLAALAWAPAQAGAGRMWVPIRWCAVQGTNAVLNPVCSCAPTTNLSLLVRTLRASRSWNNCGVFFRGAAQFGVPNVPVIADPCDPFVNPACAGARGDIVADLTTGNLGEYLQALTACQTAWNAQGTSAAGIVGVAIRRFVAPTGVPNGIMGLAQIPPFNPSPSAANPPSWGSFAVVDEDFTVNYASFGGQGNPLLDMNCSVPPYPSTFPCAPEVMNDVFETLTAHEVGHTLSLTGAPSPNPFGHLAGTVMAAAVPSTPAVTLGGFGQQAQVCPLATTPVPISQCGRVRLHSVCNVNGVAVDPPPVVEEIPDAIGDASWPIGYADLRVVGLSDDTNTGVATFYWETMERPAPNAMVVYAFAADLDQNPFTGGNTAELALPMAMAGVELAGRVTLFSDSFGATFTTENLWRYQPGPGFVPQPTLGSSAAARQIVADPPPPLGPGVIDSGEYVTLSAPRPVLLDPSPVLPRVVAAVRDETTGAVDLTEPEGLYLIPPSLPVCQVVPEQGLPGEPVTVTAVGLPANEGTSLLYMAEGYGRPFPAPPTGPAGSVAAGFVIPMNASPGDHNVAIAMSSPDLAISADCAVTVLAPGGAPGEAGAAGDMLVTGFDRQTGQVSVAYPPACQATGHTIYVGQLDQVSSYAYTQMVCIDDASGTATFATGPDDAFWLVAGRNRTVEGSYGRASSGAERPEDSSLSSVCTLPQELEGTCLP